jgi:hypothetical protein
MNKSYLFLLRLARRRDWRRAALVVARPLAGATARPQKARGSLPSIDSKFTLRNTLAQPKECKLLFTVYISFLIIARETCKFHLQTNPSRSVLQTATGSLVEQTLFDTI